MDKKTLLLPFLIIACSRAEALDLPALENMAVENSNNVKIYYERIESSKEAYKSSKSALYPSLTASGEADYNSYKAYSGLKDGLMGQAGIELSLDLAKPLSGVLLPQLEVRKNSLSLGLAKSETLKEMRQAYYGLYILLGKEADYAEAVEYFNSHIEDIEKLEKNGLDLKLDRSRAEIKLNLIKSQLEQTRSDIRSLLRTVSSLAGREVKEEEIAFGPDKEFVSLLPGKENGFVSISSAAPSLADIPVLCLSKLASLDTLSSMETYRQSRYSWAPTLTLGLSKSLNAIDPATEIYRTYFSASLYIFDFGSRTHERESLRREYEASKKSEAETIRTLKLSVEDLVGEIKNAAENYFALENSYKAAAENMETAMLYYRQGKIKETDLLDVFSEHLDVKEQARDALGSYLEKNAELQYTMSSGESCGGAR